MSNFAWMYGVGDNSTSFLCAALLHPTADSKCFKKMFKLIILKYSIYFGWGKSSIFLIIDFRVRLQHLKVVIGWCVWTKPGSVLPAVIVFVLRASRSRPALDNLRKHSGPCADWLNTFWSICALNYFACFPNFMVCYGLSTFLFTFILIFRSCCVCQLQLTMLCIGCLKNSHHLKEDMKPNPSSFSWLLKSVNSIKVK